MFFNNELLWKGLAKGAKYKSRRFKSEYIVVDAIYKMDHYRQRYRHRH